MLTAPSAGRKGNGTTALVLIDSDRTPLEAIIAATNDHEVLHIERLMTSTIVDLPCRTRLLYAKAADSDSSRDRLNADGFELICDHRRNRTKPCLQDRRTLSCVQRLRWNIERTNNWLHHYDRFTIRTNRITSMFLGWNQRACLSTLLYPLFSRGSDGASSQSAKGSSSPNVSRREELLGGPPTCNSGNTSTELGREGDGGGSCGGGIRCKAGGSSTS